MKDRYVLDSYALIAYLRAEAGAGRTRELLEAAGVGAALLLMSLVNLGEVAYLVERRSGGPMLQRVLAIVGQLPIDIVAPDMQQTLLAAGIKARHPLSFADAFAAALAESHDAMLVTGDPEFRVLEPQLSIMWLER